MPLRQVGNCAYTAISTAGTTTLNPGQASGPPTSQGCVYGAQVNNAGTGFAIALYDIVPAIGLQPVTTNTLMPSSTGTTGQYLTVGPPDLGVRYNGALVAVTSGTPGQVLALWD